MTKRILIIGGYGNFGSFITKSLASQATIQVIIAGRNLDKAKTLAKTLDAAHAPECARLDIHDDLTESLARLVPDIVIHTSGPFQAQGYDVAQACIAQGCHYIDLADGRDFVAGITALHEQAENRKMLVISGASSVPCLTSALVDEYRGEFQAIESLDYGITTAQKTARGLATTAAILSYTGKPFFALAQGKRINVFGWQSLHLRKYTGLGWRLLGNCDVPDLALFPARYPELKNLRFYAGLELPFIHVALWTLSWFVRAKLVKSLAKAAPFMLKTSYFFDWMGTANSGFHMDLSGIDTKGATKTISFELTARSGDGPYIPCMPAILLAKKIVTGELTDTGAHPCMGFITKDEYLGALQDMDITWSVR
jgi:hypothetical protein